MARQSVSGQSVLGQSVSGWRALVGVGLLAALLGGCSGDFSADPADAPPEAGPDARTPAEDRLFGQALTLDNVSDGSLLDTVLGGGNSAGAGGDGALPINRFLWQASLETLDFLPLASTDPFTGVIATDWSAARAAPGERFKVTVYHVRPALEASSLRVAVFREVRREDGLWVPEPANPETARQIEDAILVRARQIRIADLEGAAETG